MADAGTMILLVVLLFATLAALSGFIRRPEPGMDDGWRRRYLLVRNLCLACPVFFLIECVASFHLHDRPLFKRFLAPGCLILIWVVFFLQFLQARRNGRAQPDFTTHRRKPLPLFFWQALLILLPVGLMSLFGFWAIFQQRKAIEQDAQQNAQSILHSLPDSFGSMVANHLTSFDGWKNGWYSYLQGGVASWPGDKNRNLWLADTNEAQIISNNLAALHAAFPRWQDGPVPLVDFTLSTNGDLPYGPQMPPQPPAWLEIMSPEQMQAWSAIQATASTTQALSNLVNDFRQTRPPKSAMACAEFLKLCAESSSLSASNAINQLLAFADRHHDDVSESGVPLGTLALAVALHRAQDCGPSETLWWHLQGEISNPTVLSPILLDEASRFGDGNPQLAEGIKAMRILLADKMAQADLAEALEQSDKQEAHTKANVWVDAMGRHWFCILSPSILSPSETWVHCYPQSIVASGFANALADAKVSLPGYFGMVLQLEGETVPLPSPWSHWGGMNTASDVLARETFQMFQPAMLQTQNPDGTPGKVVRFDAMPGHPHFSLGIALTDRILLYARQRQLQWILGSMISASALAALVGVFAAYRAFKRERQLSEMKSNFVSSVSHELRAPIASVRLMAENLERGRVPDAARQADYFRFIGQECRRLSSLIENVLDFSRIEQGRKQYEFEPTDVMAMAQNTFNLMEPYASEKGVRLVFESCATPAMPESIELELDGRAMQQALINLLDNAIKHSARGQTVTFEARFGGGGRFNLSVLDQGPGIPTAEHEKIFERFYRLGSELRRETQGIGIGLSIVKHIVEAHGGEVRVESRPGQGSRFTIELPAKN